MKFPKLLPVLFAASLFIMGSCTDDEDSTPIDGIQACKAVKITDEDGVTSVTYANDKISSFSNGEFGSVNVQYHSSGSKAGKPSKLVFTDGDQGDGTLEYTYDDQGKLTGTLLTGDDMDGMGMASEIEYSGNRISKITRLAVIPAEEDEEPVTFSMGWSTFQYDSKGNVSKATEYYDNPLTEEDESTSPAATTEYTYDAKNSPISAFEALFVGLPGLNPASVNNVITEVRKEGSTVDKDLSYTNTYVFNDKGYPTKITKTTQNNDVTTMNVEYSCQ
ncbi:hypothetical protein [Rufibacter hautae]|uniref:DUF4595 domain-containing protein n=1 Tax=Rufibacter hautae TaxID=2595005 RepID=A0A5B6TEU0_9BACT|nr:hypothetical protein [Rufibacter hautae]KAA3439152.1 hypothetical protein FOA19_00255 [Rufibacter hautae]